MKLFTALSIALISLNSLALPVFSEGYQKYKNVYPDHENPNMFHFMPDKVVPVFGSDGKPLFSVSYSKSAKHGMANGFFEIDQAKAFYFFQKQLRKDGKDLYEMKALAKRFKLTDTAGMFTDIFEDKSDVELDGWILFDAQLTDKGLKELPALMKNPETVLFSSCYEIQGMTPEFNGEISLNFEKVLSTFKSNEKSGFTRKYIYLLVEYMVATKEIKITKKGGDAQNQDYASIITEKLIRQMFDKDLNLKADFKNVETKYEVIADRKEILKELCIDVTADFVQTYPEVLKNADAKE